MVSSFKASARLGLNVLPLPHKPLPKGTCTIVAATRARLVSLA